MDLIDKDVRVVLIRDKRQKLIKIPLAVIISIVRISILIRKAKIDEAK